MTFSLLRLAVALLSLGASLCGCNCGPGTPIFPVDYRELGYLQGSNCVRSVDHELNYVKIWIDPANITLYCTKAPEFPPGAVIVKELYEDLDCTGPVIGYAAMRKEAPGTLPEANDWTWQSLEADLRVTDEGAIARCYCCHMNGTSEPPRDSGPAADGAASAGDAGGDAGGDGAVTSGDAGVGTDAMPGALCVPSMKTLDTDWTALAVRTGPACP